jgi:adenylate cyclase
MAIDDTDDYVRVKLSHLAQEKDSDAYLRSLLDICARATDAERASIYIVDRARNEVRSLAAQRADVEIRLPLGRGLAGSSAATGETINVTDAYEDPRFERGVDQSTGFRTRTALTVPVWPARSEAVVGVLQVLNKRDGAFERHDQMLLERVAVAAAPFIERQSKERSA